MHVTKKKQTKIREIAYIQMTKLSDIFGVISQTNKIRHGDASSLWMRYTITEASHFQKEGKKCWGAVLSVWMRDAAERTVYITYV